MKFIIPGNPIAKKRHRMTRKGHSYDPQEREKKATQAKILAQLRQPTGQHNLIEIQAISESQAFSMSFEFHCPATKADPWGLNQNLNKTDVDNMVKFYCDACNSILYSDDHKIVALKAIKCYSPFKPKTIIDIEPMNVTPQISDSEIKVLKVFTPDMMKDFLYDVGVLAQYSPADWDIMTKEESMDWTSDVAKLQYSFAQKWSDKLKKVAK